MTSSIVTIDWERAEWLYRQGKISVREIARQAKVSEGAVRKRAKGQGWSREPSTQIDVDAEVEAVALAIRSFPPRESGSTKELRPCGGKGREARVGAQSTGADSTP
jgi:hypothetical protein